MPKSDSEQYYYFLLFIVNYSLHNTDHTKFVVKQKCRKNFFGNCAKSRSSRKIRNYNDFRLNNTLCQLANSSHQ